MTDLYVSDYTFGTLYPTASNECRKVGTRKKFGIKRGDLAVFVRKSNFICEHMRKNVSPLIAFGKTYNTSY